MIKYLMLIFIAISISCFYVAFSKYTDKSRKGLRLTFCLLLSIMIPLLIHTMKVSLLNSGIMEGIPLIVVYFIIPPITFIIFQRLLYDI